MFNELNTVEPNENRDTIINPYLTKNLMGFLAVARDTWHYSQKSGL